MITNGIEVDPETGAGYDRLPVSPELRALIRDTHRNPQRYEARYEARGPTQASERRSSAAPQRSNSAFHRPDDLAREKLRLRLEVMRRMRA
jgi:hypothetical protein